jgi:putative spermidine/putrescine transport system substrate-binding protein
VPTSSMPIRRSSTPHSLLGVVLGVAAATSAATSGLVALDITSSSASASARAPSSTATGYPASAPPVTITINTDLNGPIAGTNLLPYQNVWVPQFEKVYPNIHVKIIASATSGDDQALYDRIIAAQHANAAPPVNISDSSILPQLIEQNAGTKITAAEVPLLNEVDPSLLAATNYEAIPFRGSSVVLAYNSQFVKSPPTSLSSLLSWIQANPGKFTYNTPASGGSGEGFVQAVVNTGIPAAQESIFENGYKPGLESDWSNGLKTLASLKADIYNHGFYPDGNTATLDLLANGSIWAAPAWSDQATSALGVHQLPPSVKLAQINPPMPGGPADLMVIKGSPNQQAAFTFINYMLSPAEQELVAKYMKGYPGVEWKYAPEPVLQEFGPIAKTYAPAWDAQYTDDLAQKWQNAVAAS